MNGDRVINSAYMYWAKTQSHTRYNLVISDMEHCPIEELTGPGGSLTAMPAIVDGGSYGYRPLIDAIGARYGMPPESVVLSVGTSLANHIAMAALIGRGDEVLLEHPAYELLSSTLAYLGATVLRFERRFEDGFAVDPEALRKRISPRTRLIVLTNLHNPSSAYCDEKTIAAIGEIAAGVSARVLVDEVYLDAAFDARPQTAARLGKQFVTTSSLTKVYGLSELRCGWILCEPKLAERMRRLSDLFHSSHVLLAERLGTEAFRRLPLIAERSKRLLEGNTALLNTFLKGRADLKAVPHVRGLVSFPHIGALDDRKLAETLKMKYETSVVPGSFFGMPHHIRIGIGRTAETLGEGLRRLGLGLDELGSRRQGTG